MILGPVFSVELLTGSRRARYFVVRVVYGAALLVALWVQYEETFGVGSYATYQQRLAEFAAGFFRTLSVMQLLAVLLLTPTMVAGTIAEEKERRTLEYLLASDLFNREIVLGKLAARLLQLAGQIAVGLPVLALTRLLGGVAVETIAGVFAVTLATLLTAAAFSVWSSVQCRRARDAVSRVFVVGVALLLLPPLASWFPLGTSVLSEALHTLVIEPLRGANPFVCLSNVFGSSGPDWSSVGVLVRNQAVLAVPCLVLAVARLRAVCLRQAFGRAARPRGRTLRFWRPTLAEQPMVWKELFSERPAGSMGVTGTAAQLLLLAAVLAPSVWIFVIVIMNDPGATWRWDRVDFCRYLTVMATAVVCIAMLLAAVRAATSVTAERERQTWDVLLSTPLEGREIVWGKIVGSLYATRGLLALVAVLWLLGLLAGSLVPLVLPVVAMEIAVIGLCAVALGVLFSLRMKSSLWSMAATLGTSVFVAGGYLFCCIPLMRGPDTEVILAGCVPFLLGFPLAIDPDWTHHAPEQVARLSVICAVGVGFYFLAMLGLLAAAIGGFDSLVGRTTRLALPEELTGRSLAHAGTAGKTPAAPELTTHHSPLTPSG